MAVDLEDGDSIRVLGALARALNGAGVGPTIEALNAVAEHSDNGGDGDRDTSANSRPDGRRILAPDPPGDGEAWETPSLSPGD